MLGRQLERGLDDAARGVGDEDVEAAQLALDRREHRVERVRVGDGIFVIVGAILVLGTANDTFTRIVGFVALVLASANVVGGWFVTDRMLEMFKRRPEPRREDKSE